jgi:hypothetical protein
MHGATIKIDKDTVLNLHGINIYHSKALPYVTLENMNIFRKFPIIFVSFTTTCYSLNMSLS